MSHRLSAAIVVMACLAPSVLAQTPAAQAASVHGVNALAKETQNPVKLASSVNVVARTIVPINSAPLADGSHSSGIGDIQQQIFFTPAKPGGMIWGVGPTFSFPTATVSVSETGTWAMGPAAVLVKNTGPWVLGSLISQLWPMSDAGGDPEMNLLTIQPFVNYNFGHGWATSFSPIITANWDAPDGNQWTVPLGIGLTRTTVFNHRPMNIGINYYYNVSGPTAVPDNSSG